MENKSLKTIIVDDEINCIRNLEAFLSRNCPRLSIMSRATRLEDASQQLASQVFDVAYVDIQMADRISFDILENFQYNRCALIFVTAFEQYALQAFSVGAIDYIVKPLNDKDIKRAYDKILNKFYGNSLGTAPPATLACVEKVVISQGDKVFVVKMEDIIHVTGNGFYSNVYFKHKDCITKAVVSKPLSILEKEYPAASFFRIHKSHLINTKYISGLLKGDSTIVSMYGGSKLPVAKRRQNEFIAFLKQAP